MAKVLQGKSTMRRTGSASAAAVPMCADMRGQGGVSCDVAPTDPPTRTSRRMSRRLVSEVDRQQQILDSCPRHPGAECVYVFVQRSGTGYVKIGTTIDLNQRAGDHQSNAFGELRLVAAFHGSYDLLVALVLHPAAHGVMSDRTNRAPVPRQPMPVVRLFARPLRPATSTTSIASQHARCVGSHSASW